MSFGGNNFFSISSFENENLFLSSFIKNDPKKNAIFNTQMVPNEIIYLANQLFENCAICLCKKKSPFIVNNCCHVFCDKCILAWTKKQNLPLLCKRNIISLKHFK